MFHRFSTWWRALSVVLLSLATVTWPSAAQAETTAPVLLHQGTVVNLSRVGSGRFSTSLRIVHSTSPVSVQVSIFPRIIERVQLAPIIDGAGDASAPIATTNAFELLCIAHDKATFDVTILAHSHAATSTRCESSAASLRLSCSGSTCNGVYPLRFSITRDTSTSTLWSLVSVQSGQVLHPLHVDVIETLPPSVLDDASLSTSVLDVIAAHSQFPLALDADYRTLAVLQSSNIGYDIALRSALSKALQSPLHQAVVAPPANIDYGGLVANGLSNQVQQQLSLSSNILQQVTGRYVDSPVVLTGSPSLQSLRALSSMHVQDVVINDDSLSPAPSSTLEWGAPFHITTLPSITFLSTDSPLDDLLNNTSITPGERSVLALETLAFLHFEAPDAPAVRTIVLELNPSRTSATLESDFLNGFASNPFVVASSLAPSFESSLIGSNGAPSERTLVAPSTSVWTARNVNDLLTTIGQINSFNQAVTSTSVSNTLRVAVAQSEISGTPAAREDAISSATSALNAQLRNFSVNQSSVTLAGPGTALPITLLSSASYSITAVVHLITDRLTFPKGNTVAVTLDSQTKSIRVPTSSRGGDLTLQVVVTTPNDQVILARTAIQVRIAGNSVVGYLLSIGSLLVLGFWWLRTNRRRSKGRHAR
jgi:hypothetical protein